MSEHWTLCGECDCGLLWLSTPLCTCDPGPEGQHHWYCGAQMCPNGCWDRLGRGDTASLSNRQED